MKNARISLKAAMLGGCAVAALAAGPAVAEQFSVEAQDLRPALQKFASQGDQQVLFSNDVVAGKRSAGFSGDASPEVALQQLLAGTDLTYRRNGDTFLITSASDPQSGSAAGDGADQGTVQALIVTAQKREENIQDVPIAMSAFTQEDLTKSQVTGGPDLMTQVPNMTFTKTNFSSYSIQLRGIGTQAISATVDPAVAVAFNNTPFIRNRFFEQEFYDLQRVEVLRGPQGTLYGRNATAGVVNIISAKPKFIYEGRLSADVGNYSSSRLEGRVNVPLVEDKVALRIAGAWTKRDGYATNELTGHPIDGRDLWSTRTSLRFTPNDRLDANLIWEHFQEDDDRIRSGKQLCKTDEVTNVAGFPTTHDQTLAEYGQNAIFSGVQASFSQGCAPASLYAPESFQTPNGLALPYYVPLGAVSLPISRYDPYTNRYQSRDLRMIDSVLDPQYRARTDAVELQIAYDLADHLTLNSETAWGSDFIFSTQDYNRFNTAPGAWSTSSTVAQDYLARGILSPDGVFCDPQIGCSDRLIAQDLSTARSRQFSQEFRLASDYDGPVNFSVGANFLRYDTEDKYYVFINSLSLISAYDNNNQGMYTPNVTDNRDCLPYGMTPPDYTKAQPILQCTYIDPNPIGSLNDLGHNYFLSRNPYKLISYAVFGEVYYKLADNLKLTAGLRWTVDKKEAPLIPSWLFASNTAGHPTFETIRQEWREPTGRLAIDWKPDLGFTDQTLLYASYSHGYKAGGMNPPPYGKALYNASGDLGAVIAASSALHPKTFDPEFVDAFELGSKNVLLDGRLTLNGAAFYYDYRGYQLSQIVDRSAVTVNYDADVWGLEFESDWRPLENLRLGLKLGYEKTKVARGEKAIDVMDRVAGHAGWVLNRPFPSIPSNCVLPEWLLLGNTGLYGHTNPELVNVGGKGGGNPGGCEVAYLLGKDPATAAPYRFDPYNTPGPVALGEFNPGRADVNYAAWSTNLADYPCWPTDPSTGQPATIGTRDYPGVDPACLAALSNNGEGFYKDLSGHELPNAPHMTATLTADYSIPLPNDWLATLHTDLYYQSEAWTRIFNTPGYDKLKAYTNVNLAAIFTNEDAGWKIMAYVKNVFDRTSITGAFLNSDDSGLTTNVFLTEPRLYGLRVTKDFAGGPWWTGANPASKGPFPLTVEVSGQVQRQHAPYENLTADWVDTLPQAIALQDVQNRPLDWGDGRSVKVTYRPDGSRWSASAAVRYGRTNNQMTRTSATAPEHLHVCSLPEEDFRAPYICDGVLFYGNSYYYPTFTNVQVTDWSDAEARSREEHLMVDFGVGADLGIGLGGLRSQLGGGIRYADFKSQSHWAANTQSGWDVPQGWGFSPYNPRPGYFTPSSVYQRHASLDAERKFKGAGPVLTWDGAFPLMGDEARGHLNVDWSITGGALLGKRRTEVNGRDVAELHSGRLAVSATTDTESIVTGVPPLTESTTTPISIFRSKNATAPLVDLSLGLSYDVGRIKVGTGYRWERYYNVLDVGFEQEKKADRTFDGPYFKIAVGFGG